MKVKTLPKKQSKEKNTYEVKDDIRDIRNDIERIKSDTHNINRILTLGNFETIKQDLENLIGKSVKKTAAIVYTSEYISASDLASKMNLDPRNLNKFLQPIIEKGYITTKKEGNTKLFKRSEIFDLIGFENMSEFKELLKKVEEKTSDS